MKNFFHLLIFMCLPCLAQKNEVAVTIDDIPNVHVYKQDGFKATLLERIESLDIPVAAFINEKNVYDTNFEKNIIVLKQWLKSENITAGNHSFSHINYADTTLAGFQADILKGEKLTTEFTKQRPRYFRFPFNSLGNDSIAHDAIRKFLDERGYVHAPFTIESEDWAYNALYENALKNNDRAKAVAVGQQYVSQTLKIFQHFEALSRKFYGRNVKHIYLCHDNQLNRDYFGQLVTELKKKSYSFISLERALEDEVYQSKEYYKGRYGFSWLYRWEKDPDRRKTLMQAEPTDGQFLADYEKFLNKQ
jgi:peptidoglycan-N-acetylglucosamine deacetylase